MINILTRILLKVSSAIYLILNVNRQVGCSRRASFTFAIFVGMLTKMLMYLKDSRFIEIQVKCKFCRGLFITSNPGNFDGSRMIELFVWLISARGRPSRLKWNTKRVSRRVVRRTRDSSRIRWSKHNKRIIKFKLQRQVSWRLNAKRTWRNSRRGKWKLRTWSGTLPSYLS